MSDDHSATAGPGNRSAKANPAALREAALRALGQTAEWLVLTGDFDEATARYRFVLEDAPSSPMVHHHLGRLLMQVGKRAAGAAHFQYLAQFGELDQVELRSLLAISTPLPQVATSGRLEPLTRLARARREMALNRLVSAIEIIEFGAKLSDAEECFRARIHAVQEDFEAVQRWASSREPSASESDGWFALGVPCRKPAGPSQSDPIVFQRASDRSNRWAGLPDAEPIPSRNG